MDSGQLVNEVAATLNDAGFVRWTELDLIGYLNAGCLELCRVNPKANAGIKTIALQQGTRQSIGSTGLSLFEVVRNIPSGRAVRRVAGSSLSALLPLWHSADGYEDVREFIQDENDLRAFWVYPPALDTSVVECSVCLKPEVIIAPASGQPYDPFPLRDEFSEAVKAWMLYQAYSVDTGTGAKEKAQYYVRLFYQSMGMAGKDE